MEIRWRNPRVSTYEADVGDYRVSIKYRGKVNGENKWDWRIVHLPTGEASSGTETTKGGAELRVIEHLKAFGATEAR